jgi:hypothetical protein
LPGTHEAPTGGLVLRLPAGGCLSCLPGTRLGIPEKPGDPIQLDRGTLWCRAEGVLQIRIPQGLLRITQGDAALRCGAPRATAWSLCREARAEEETRVDLVLLAGSRALWKEADWTGPCRVRIGENGTLQVQPLDDRILAEAFAWRDEAEGAGPWQEVRTGNVGSPGSRGEALLEHLPSDAIDLVMEVMLKAPAGSQVGLCYPQGGCTTYTTLGSGALSPDAWQVFRLRRLGGRLEVFAESRRIVSTEEASGRTAAERPAVGLLVWQGPVEVRRLRWRALGSR